MCSPRHSVVADKRHPDHILHTPHVGRKVLAADHPRPLRCVDRVQRPVALLQEAHVGQWVTFSPDTFVTSAKISPLRSDGSTSASTASGM